MRRLTAFTLGLCVLATSTVLLLAACKHERRPATDSLSPVERYRRRSIGTEAVTNLAMLARMAVTYATAERVAPTGVMAPPSFPASAPMTPARVPGARPVTDPPETWTHPSWVALGFSVSDPHYYSYEFISDGSSFTVRAYGDLDGDGVLSTFERTGHLNAQNEVELSAAVRMVNELE